jgi:hypothetical protein
MSESDQWRTFGEYPRLMLQADDLGVEDFSDPD